MLYQRTPRLSRLPARFPNQIRVYRLKAGLSQAALAHQLGVRTNTLSAWERGLSCPVAPVLMKLAKALSTLSEAIYWEFYSSSPRSSRPTQAA